MLRPIAQSGHDPVSSMGDDTAMPPLAGRHVRSTSYFRQRFAQVTNPAIDHLRERFVMSVSTLLGARGRPLADGGSRCPPLIVLPGFLLYPAGLDALAPSRPRHHVHRGRGARGALHRLAGSLSRSWWPGDVLLCLSDREAAGERAPRPRCSRSRRCTAASSSSACGCGARSSSSPTSLVTRHAIACLLGYGADGDLPEARARDRRRSWPRTTGSAATGPRPRRPSGGSGTRSRMAS